MLQLIEANVPAVAMVLGLIVAFLWFLVRGRSSRSRERHRTPDALDEGAAPAARNQALIDAPSAASLARSAKEERPVKDSEV